MNIVKIKQTAKRITNITIGAIYFPIYLCFCVVRFIARFVLAISHFGTLNGAHGKAIMKSLFQKDYERYF